MRETEKGKDGIWGSLSICTEYMQYEKGNGCIERKKRKGMDAEMENVSDVWGMKK